MPKNLKIAINFSHLKTLPILLLLLAVSSASSSFAQIRNKSLDLGLDGRYYTAPLVISLGGGGIEGGFRAADFKGQLGYFLFENFAVGFRFSQTYEFFWVERQHFNSNLGTYQPYEQTENAYLYGLYARYYIDFSEHVAFFGHGEIGIGRERVTYTQDDSISSNGFETVRLNRDLSDMGLSIGLALRPSPRVGLELQVMRRFVLESYNPLAGSTLVQTENYQGYEFRIGARINLDLAQAFQRNKAKNIRTF